MGIISFAVTLAVIGFIIWLILQIPMPDVIQRIIVGLICVLIVLYVLQSFGIHLGAPLTVK